ncbi:hypothetical protein L2Y96_13810 [Luteibacter aegosomaticola]|uniref:hypothetical protein n=1 Tax=Luteibacter aegosomaticola TaxID=2911538 RepID=UPI001FFA8926|nr:hypothetical protein [Luteibacter aegosomaticola]UPG88494.1 hypothetical protein L2Y96_13810 [Luteibacter aegosomaticola]
MFKNLIPKVFYDHLQEGIEFFVDGLGFAVLYRDDDMAVIARDGAKAYLVESPEFAAKDRPELSIDTDDLDGIFQELSQRVPHLLHPNGNRPQLKPWGSREFAMLDKTTVCVIFREWPEDKNS